MDLEKAVQAVREKTSFESSVGIILGTGLGGLAREIEVECAIPYADIPGFPLATVETHKGDLLFGRLDGRPVIAMRGRFHVYEGWTLQQIAFPVRVLRRLGVQHLMISNACGSMNPLIRKGALMIIDDHINLLGGSPLIGPNDNSIGPRFPDMSEPYSRALIEMAETTAMKAGIKIHRGVYVAVSGPQLETRAEYRFLRGIGADVVGMSTVPEVIAAVHAGMKVFGLSIVTDECYPEALRPVNVEEIIATAMGAEPQMTKVLRGMIDSLYMHPEALSGVSDL